MLYRALRPAYIKDRIVNYTKVGPSKSKFQSLLHLLRRHPKSYIVDDHNHMVAHSFNGLVELIV